MNDKAKKLKLLPIGTRVVHYDGCLGKYVKGTILGYNRIESCKHPGNKSKEVSFPRGASMRYCDRTGGLHCTGVAPSCPYIIRFDPEPDSLGNIRYIEGYLDVYAPRDIRPLDPAENIFPNDTIQIMARQWPVGDGGRYEIKTWTTWKPMTEEEYEQNKENSSFEFCIRQINLAYAWVMIPLWQGYSSKERHDKGYRPPPDTAVRFHLRDGSAKIGITAQVILTPLGGNDMIDALNPVFISTDEGSMRIYTIEEVQEWCDAIQPTREKL